MPDGMSMSIDGLEQALAELRAVPQVIAQRVLKGAVATGASVIRREVIRQAPSMSGTLKQAVYQARNTQLCTPVQETFKVGVRRGKLAVRKVKGQSVSVDAYYAIWVERGHYARVPHATTKTAKAAARAAGTAAWVPAHPFFRPAVAASSDAALQAMRDYIRAQLSLATSAMQYLKAA